MIYSVRSRRLLLLWSVHQGFLPCFCYALVMLCVCADPHNLLVSNLFILSPSAFVYVIMHTHLKMNNAKLELQLQVYCLTIPMVPDVFYSTATKKINAAAEPIVPAEKHPNVDSDTANGASLTAIEDTAVHFNQPIWKRRRRSHKQK
ncbi:hypothetical protein VPH35_128899 [Triticum aestivum]